MEKKEEIALLMVNELAKCPNGTETSVSELLDKVVSGENPEFSIEDIFDIDAMFRKKAISRGLMLDSMKHDFNPGLPLDRSFVLRRI